MPYGLQTISEHSTTDDQNEDKAGDIRIEEAEQPKLDKIKNVYIRAQHTFDSLIHKFSLFLLWKIS